MIFLTTIIYQENRKNEIIECLKVNAKHNFIKKFVIFLERVDGDDEFVHTIQDTVENNKLDLQLISHRPMIKEMVDYVQQEYPSSICLITNSDIMFYKGFEKLNRINYNKYNIALTRYNPLPHKGKVYNYRGIELNVDKYKLKSMWHNGLSTDTWIFKLPLQVNKLLDFPLGTVHGDSYLNKLLADLKPTLNPIYDVISIHLHEYWSTTNYRNPNHSSKQYWKPRYRKNQKSIRFTKLTNNHFI